MRLFKIIKNKKCLIRAYNNLIYDNNKFYLLEINIRLHKDQILLITLDINKMKKCQINIINNY